MCCGGMPTRWNSILSGLADVEQRLGSLHSAARRFRVEPEALHELQSRLEARFNELQSAADLDALLRQEQQAESGYRDQAKTAHTGAQESSGTAGARSKREHERSGDERCSPRKCRWCRDSRGGAHGEEIIEFLFAAAAGTEARSLSRVASGGELSRISLAIQVITGRAAALPTLIFDEVMPVSAGRWPKWWAGVCAASGPAARCCASRIWRKWPRKPTSSGVFPDSQATSAAPDAG